MQRVDALPDVATTREQGYDFESSVLYLLLAPAKTPQATLRLLNEKTNEALAYIGTGRAKGKVAVTVK